MEDKIKSTFKTSYGDVIDIEYLDIQDTKALLQDNSKCDSETYFSIIKKLQPITTARLASGGNNGKIEKETSEPAAIETTGFEVAIPMEGHTGITLRNLVNMIYSKQTLIKKSLGILANIIEDDFCIGINKAKTETLEDFKAAIKGIRKKRCPGITFDFNNNTITFKFLKL